MGFLHRTPPGQRSMDQAFASWRGRRGAALPLLPQPDTWKIGNGLPVSCRAPEELRSDARA
jgi:hypothetical protein